MITTVFKKDTEQYMHSIITIVIMDINTDKAAITGSTFAKFEFVPIPEFEIRTKAKRITIDNIDLCFDSLASKFQRQFDCSFGHIELHL